MRPATSRTRSLHRPRPGRAQPSPDPGAADEENRRGRHRPAMTETGHTPSGPGADQHRSAGAGGPGLIALVLAAWTLVASSDELHQESSPRPDFFAHPPDFFTRYASARASPWRRSRAVFNGLGRHRRAFALSINARRRHPADLRRPRRRAGLPGRAVQHRRAGPDHHRRHLARVGRLPLGPAPSGCTCWSRWSRPASRRRLWGGIAGFLKARTGAHEVITTIMLNYMAARTALRPQQGRVPAAGQDNPISPRSTTPRGLPELGTTGCTSASCSPSPRPSRCGGCSSAHHRLRVPRGRRQPQRRADRRA